MGVGGGWDGVGWGMEWVESGGVRCVVKGYPSLAPVNCTHEPNINSRRIQGAAIFEFFRAHERSIFYEGQVKLHL